MDPKLLDILVCPLCKGELQYRQTGQELICKPCKLVFPIQNGIPLMLESEAHPLVEEAG